MVATVLIQQLTGAVPTETDKTSGTIRFKNADTPSGTDTTNPLIIPTAGTEYSYKVSTEMHVSVAPDTNISNLNFYTDGANGFGTGVFMWVKTSATYSQATAPETTSGGYNDAFTKTVTAPTSIGAGPYTGTGPKGNKVELMMTVATNATQGTLTGETGTYSYDEI